MRLGIQGFGLGDRPAEDTRGFFAQLYGWGYRLFEPCIMFIDRPLPWGIWSEAVVDERIALLKELGFEIYSAHVFAQEIAPLAGKMAALAEKHGIKQFVVGPPRDTTEEAYLACAADLKAAAVELAKHGMELLVHNGSAEPTAVKLGGKTAYEFLLDACGGAVGAQPDVGWVAAGGEDAMAFIERTAKYIKSLHYKDRKGDAEAPIGRGELDSFGFFKFARLAGIPQIMDMDVSTAEDIEFAAQLMQKFENDRSWTRSVLCTLDVDSGELTELRRFEEIIEAPNWLDDGDTLLYNSNGKMWKYRISTDSVTEVPTGSAELRCSNDHTPSPDGKRFGVSAMEFDAGGLRALMYLCPIDGGEPVQLTFDGASWLHGWSPDGEELAYCAFRGEDVDIYTMPASGGAETRLTDGSGYADGPEYSPDGKHIWFNTTRSGLMQLWRMDRDGSNLTRMHVSEDNDWFPHLSPDGKRVVYITFRRGDLEPKAHLPNLWVKLSIMDADGSNDRELVEFFGGQSSINVNSWSPDCRRVALVKYEAK